MYNPYYGDGSSNAIVSNILAQNTQELDAKPQDSGREAFLKRRVGVVEKEECIAQPEDSKTFTTARLPELDADIGRLRNACCLPQLRLSDDLMKRRDIDLELFEFLTAPASVQMMDPETWVEAWGDRMLRK